MQSVKFLLLNLFKDLLKNIFLNSQIGSQCKYAINIHGKLPILCFLYMPMHAHIYVRFLVVVLFVCLFFRFVVFITHCFSVLILLFYCYSVLNKV